MAKREILRAAKKVGIRIESARYEWTPTPGEMVPQWVIEFHAEDEENFPIHGNPMDFESSAQAVEYIEELSRVEAQTGGPA